MPEANVLSRLFDRLAASYDRHAALEQEVGRRLLERLTFLRRDPACVVDAGCATGELSGSLKRRFRKARVIGIDLAPLMLARLRRRSTLLRRLAAVCGDLGRLPLKDQSVDLLVCNLALHWSQDLRGALDECCRVLRPDGMLLFATLGPGTLAELRDAWSSIDARARFLELPDPLQIGDAMLASGLLEPVVDTDRVRLEFPGIDAMARELEATGSSLLVDGWERWQDHRDRLAGRLGLAATGARLGVSFEVIYGTAFGPAAARRRPRPDADVLRIPVDNLLPSRPMG